MWKRPAIRLIGVAAAFLGASWLGFALVIQPFRAARLPALPDLAGRPAALAASLREADRAAQARPTSADAVGALGLAYHANQFFDEAARCYELAAELDSNAWRWQYYGVLLKVDRGQMDQVAAALRALVAVEPGYAPAWFRLAEEEFKRGGFDAAADAYTRAIAADRAATPGVAAAAGSRPALLPVAVHASLGLSRVALQQDRLDEARARLEALTGEVPRFGSAHRLLGEVYRRLGRDADVERHLEQALLLRPYAPPADPLVDALVLESRDSTLLLKQASMADRAGDQAWRERLTRRAFEFDRDNPEVVYRMGVLLLSLERPADALPFFEQHRRMDPDRLDSLTQIGRALIALERLAEAEQVLRQALASDDAEAHYNFAWVLDERGRFAEAVEHYRKAIDRNPNHADAHYNLGLLSVREGRRDEAAQHFSAAIASHPAHADAHTNLAITLVQRGLVEEGLEHYATAIAINPNHLGARFNLALGLARLGRLEEAVREFETIVRLDPTDADAHRYLEDLRAKIPSS